MRFIKNWHSPTKCLIEVSIVQNKRPHLLIIILGLGVDI